MGWQDEATPIVDGWQNKATPVTEPWKPTLPDNVPDRLKMMAGLADFAVTGASAGAAEVLGVEEDHRLAVGAQLGLAVAEDARPPGREPVARGDDVIDLEA